MLWLWGLSGHRYLALLLHEAAAAQQLRVLCVDRPGQGGSTPPVAGGMRVLAWPGARRVSFGLVLHHRRFDLILIMRSRTSLLRCFCPASALS